MKAAPPEDLEMNAPLQNTCSPYEPIEAPARGGMQTTGGLR